MCCLALDQSHPVFESVLGMGLLFDRHMLATNMLQQAEWLLCHVRPRFDFLDIHLCVKKITLFSQTDVKFLSFFLLNFAFFSSEIQVVLQNQDILLRKLGISLKMNKFSRKLLGGTDKFLQIKVGQVLRRFNFLV